MEIEQQLLQQVISNTKEIKIVNTMSARPLTIKKRER